MTRNLGDVDRTVRLLFGAAIGVIYSTRRLQGTPQLLLGLVCVLLLATALTGWGPLYALFRISTRRPTDASSETPTTQP